MYSFSLKSQCQTQSAADRVTRYSISFGSLAKTLGLEELREKKFMHFGPQSSELCSSRIQHL